MVQPTKRTTRIGFHCGTDSRRVIIFVLWLVRVSYLSHQATLALRFKHATSADIQFLESYESNKKWHKHGIFAEETSIPFVVHRAKIVKKMKRHGKTGPAGSRGISQCTLLWGLWDKTNHNAFFKLLMVSSDRAQWNPGEKRNTKCGCQMVLGLS
jgi:hypothetical protein